MNLYTVKKREMDDLKWHVVRRWVRTVGAAGKTVCRHATRRLANQCCWARNGNPVYKPCAVEPKITEDML